MAVWMSSVASRSSMKTVAPLSWRGSPGQETASRQSFDGLGGPGQTVKLIESLRTRKCGSPIGCTPPSTPISRRCGTKGGTRLRLR